MFDFEKTRLWSESLGRTTTRHTHRKDRERLRAAFSSFRKNAALLAGEIPRDFDFLTVHDITHLDALWEMADLAMAKDERLSTAEVPAGRVVGKFSGSPQCNCSTPSPRPADRCRGTKGAVSARPAKPWLEGDSPGDHVRELATRLLDAHDLRAADSLQLAAALTWCQQRPAKRDLVSADQRLSRAAIATGFSVLKLS